MGKHKHHHHGRRDFIGRMLGLGCASLTATPILNSIANLSLLNAAASANMPLIPNPNSSGYKALICLHLNGGNDSYNMLVPSGTDEYNEYATSRTNMALAQNSLLPINPTNPDGKSYGLHPSLVNVHNLFENGDLAFVANIGTLVQPTTLADFQNDISLPLGLFSHSDQQLHWHTSVPQNRNAFGWGGRLADIMYSNNSNQDISMNISLDGINAFQQGASITEYAIQSSGTGSVAINGSTSTNFYNTLKRQTLDNILDASYQNVLETAFANSVKSSKNSSIQFSSAILNGTPFTTVFPTTSLGEKFEMVAKTIAAKDILSVTNQTFFLSHGGYDMHDTLLADQATNFTELDDALGAFNAAMVELGLSDSVTTFTISDFARKLISNGDGADHGWGGTAMLMGGAVTGQKIYGTFPDLYFGNPLDTGNGRIIPTTSCDEYFADLALWFGASNADLYQILPNINNFWDPSGATYGPLGLFA